MQDLKHCFVKMDRMSRQRMAKEEKRLKRQRLAQVRRLAAERVHGEACSAVPASILRQVYDQTRDGVHSTLAGASASVRHEAAGTAHSAFEAGYGAFASYSSSDYDGMSSDRRREALFLSGVEAAFDAIPVQRPVILLDIGTGANAHWLRAAVARPAVQRRSAMIFLAGIEINSVAGASARRRAGRAPPAPH
jgi:hypothetical protein